MDLRLLLRFGRLSEMFVAEGLCAFKAGLGNLRINASEIEIIVSFTTCSSLGAQVCL